MDISLNGFWENVATFAVSGEVKSGMPVKISANGTVAPCAAKDKFCGLVLSCLLYTSFIITKDFKTSN